MIETCYHRIIELPAHLLVGLLSHSEDVGVHVPHVLATVGPDHFLSVDMELVIRVDGHQHYACRHTGIYIHI